MTTGTARANRKALDPRDEGADVVDTTAYGAWDAAEKHRLDTSTYREYWKCDKMCLKHPLPDMVPHGSRLGPWLRASVILLPFRNRRSSPTTPSAGGLCCEPRHRPDHGEVGPGLKRQSFHPYLG